MFIAYFLRGFGWTLGRLFAFVFAHLSGVVIMIVMFGILALLRGRR
ncbi:MULTISPECIES: hypothetical protein [Yersiniaceae]|uniref:Uncharacterized protein n=1 Tax=Nissabacter archeti TaxID=1917880 RepID=A0ABS5JHB1_9GAMM|nr:MULTISPECIES: hypothetical protein [Yersiniaceae]MBS0969325.1 hypothetical protein [Nissabacter archeti]MDV5140365.1 hypothetical protein [Chimaeribacter arupi]WKZ94741.1 hypothetical protein P0E69_22510 [Chimaeribacter arupi]